MPRIAHVISARKSIGGAERVVRALVRAGDASGFPQTVLNPFATGEVAGLMVPAGSPSSYAGEAADQISDLPRVRSWLRSRLRDFGPDLIHVHLFHASALVASLGQVGERARVVTHHHGDFYRAQGRTPQAWADRFITRRFDKVVAVSDAEAGFLKTEYRLGAEVVETIRNGWEGRPRSDLPKAEAPTVISVGHLRIEKGHQFLLRAFGRVRERLPEARLVIVGDGAERAALEALSAELALGSSIELAGASDDIWPLLASSQVFALPSTSEQLGIAAMEAMAAGLPVVASDVGGVSEIVKPGLNGFLVPPRDPDALGSSLLHLLQDPAAATAMGERARRSVREMTMEKMAEAYLALYARVLDPGL